MAAKDFSAIMKKGVVRDLLGKASGSTELTAETRKKLGIINVIEDGTKGLRSSQQRASITSLKISRRDIEDIVIPRVKSFYESGKAKGIKDEYLDFKDKDLSFEGFTQFIEKKLYDPNANSTLKGVGTYEEEAIVVEQIGWDTIANYYNEYFLAKGSKFSVFDEVGLHRGHFISLAGQLLSQQSDQIIERYSKVHGNLSGSDSSAVEAIIQIIDDAVHALTNVDIHSSNMGSQSLDLYGNYLKSNKEYLVEVQLKLANMASAKDSADLMNALRVFYTDPTKITPSKFTASLETIKRVVGDNIGSSFASRAFIEDLINTPGSPSYISLIENKIVSILDPKVKEDKKTYRVANEKIGSVKLHSPKEIIEMKNASKKLQADLKKLKNEIIKARLSTKQAARKIRNRTTGRFVSLTSLQALLNSKLHDQLKKNMGSPALNYKTGRFARSAEVLKLSQSRQGMITAFYTYMKNPYQTFEPGFAQGSTSRNPKTLISTSIREIAQQLVGNRLRAVLV